MTYLLEAVEEEASKLDACRVTAINVVLGERTGAIDDSLLFYFDMLTPDTLAEGAKLNIRRTRMTFFCNSCDTTYTREGDNFQCPTCGKVGQITDEGTELLVESIEIET